MAEERSLADAREDAQAESELLAEFAERMRDATRTQWAAADARTPRLYRWWRAITTFAKAAGLRPRATESDYAESEPSPKTASSSSPAPGRRWQRTPARGDLVGGRYLLMEEIGRGGYGAVHRAEDRTMKTEVAVKIMPTALTDSWWRDVRNVPIDCRWVATVLEAGPHGRRWRYIVYPIYRPGSLQTVCDEVKPERTAWWCLGVVEQTLFALAAGHSDKRYIVHRDVKPGNILLDGDEVRLADWGRARNSRDDSPSTALGTWRWTAPEVFDGRGREDISDGLSDLYSVGAVAYWLLTGKPPLAREMTDLYLDLDNDGRVIAEKRGLEPMRLDRVDPRIPTEIADIVQTWLSARARDRADGKRSDLACLYALSLLRVAKEQHRDALQQIIVPAPEPIATPEPGQGWAPHSTGPPPPNGKPNSFGTSPHVPGAGTSGRGSDGSDGRSERNNSGGSSRQGAGPTSRAWQEHDPTPLQTDAGPKSPRRDTDPDSTPEQE